MLIDRSKYKSGLEETQIRYFMKEAISNIKGIEVKLHRVNMSCESKAKLYNYSYFKGIFGPEWSVSINFSFNPEERMPNYEQQVIAKCNTCTINIYIQPIKRFIPPFFIEVTPNDTMSTKGHKSLLWGLHAIFPKMVISSVEYTIDVICYEPREVENLFTVIRRCLYAPYKKNHYHNGGSIATWGEQIRAARTFSINNFKIYERGFDKDKLASGDWNNTDCNKVRLEYTAYDYELRKNGITFLSDFIIDCCFHEIVKDKFKFKQFIGPKELPFNYKWLSYASKDAEGNSGAFHIEYRGALKNQVQHFLEDNVAWEKFIGS